MSFEWLKNLFSSKSYPLHVNCDTCGCLFEVQVFMGMTPEAFMLGKRCGYCHSVNIRPFNVFASEWHARLDAEMGRQKKEAETRDRNLLGAVREGVLLEEYAERMAPNDLQKENADLRVLVQEWQDKYTICCRERDEARRERDAMRGG